MYETQTLKVLKYLEQNKTITSRECFLKLDITDLQHAIMILRREGYPITDKWVKNPFTKKKYKVYTLEVE